MKSPEFLNLRYLVLKVIYSTKKEGVNLHKSYLWAKKIFFEVSIFEITMKFPFQRCNIIDIIGTDLKPVND